MRCVVIFGGSGFVGTHLAHMLGDKFDRIYLADIREPRWHSPSATPENPRSQYVPCDVRQPIDPTLFEGETASIVNLAAVHTSPGHETHEYFEVNILGARHITAFARERHVSRIVFTSSISVYGPGEDEKTEANVPMPTIPYGSSKIIAEYIHREWFRSSPDHRLTVARPAVIFGAGEGGNFTRIANLLEKGFFPYPGRKDTVKACLYVKDICRFIIDRLESETGYSCHNFCYPEKISTERIVAAFKCALGYRALTPLVPLWMVNVGASLLRLVNTPWVQRMGLVPDRIVKLVRSTNISARKLVDTGFSFQYSLEEALQDWANDCGGKHLY